MNTSSEASVKRRRRGAAHAEPEFYRPGAYSIGDSYGYLTRRVFNAIAQALEARLEAHGITDAQWKPLLCVSQGRATTVAELARECQSDCGAMTRMLDRLEAKNLMRRVRSSEDRRVVNVENTPEGEAVTAIVGPLLTQTLNEHLAGFSLEEFEMLKSLLRRIIANADALKEGEGAAAAAQEAVE